MKKKCIGIKNKTSGTTTAIQYICSTQRAILLIIMLTAIVLASQHVAALDFSFQAPSSADLDEEFTVKISPSQTINEEYDVKIFVHKSKEYEIPRSAYISEIYNEEKDTWADPWFYLKGAFPEEDQYEIRITDSKGEQTLCVRLRKSNDNEGGTFDEKCQEIDVEESSKSDDDEEEEEDDDEDNEERDLVYYSNSQRVIETINQEETTPRESDNQKISLSAPKKQAEKIIETPKSKKNNYLVYSLVGFLFLLLVLLALKRL